MAANLVTRDVQTGVTVSVQGTAAGIYIEGQPVQVEWTEEGVFLSTHQARVRVSHDTYRWLCGDPDHGRVQNRMTPAQHQRRPAQRPPLPTKSDEAKTEQRDETAVATWPPDEAFMC